MKRPLNINSLLHYIPESARGKIKILRDRVLRKPLLKEIQKLPIHDSGLSDEGIPWIELSGGYTFYGFLTLPHDRLLYRYLDDRMKKSIIEDAFGVALDIVTRYVYPHAQPTKTPPYSHFARRYFHPQHEDTIMDIPGITGSERRRLLDLYTIREDETVLDIGSFLGFGALKLARLVGPAGKVISFEADPDCARILKKNIDQNSPGNIIMVQKAVWNKKDMMIFYRSHKQANSLVQDMIESADKADVQADTVDNVVSDLDIHSVSLISLTVNGAEEEAIKGMSKTLEASSPRLSIAGWYVRDGQPIWKRAVALLKEQGYQTLVGKKGRVYAWK